MMSTDQVSTSNGPPPKMTTRASTSSLPLKRDPSDDDENTSRRQSREQGRDDDDCQDVPADKMSSSYERDGSPPTPEHKMLPPLKTNEDMRTTPCEEDRKTSSSSTSSRRKQSSIYHASLTAPLTPSLAVGASFDMQGLGPSTSFGGLSALGLGSGMSVTDDGTVNATNLTLTNNATPIARTPGSHFRPSSGRFGVGGDLPANMPMSELDNPSWDLLNQDSFGFNLLGSHGSLSFETGEDAANNAHANDGPIDATNGSATNGAGPNNGSSNNPKERESSKRKEGSSSRKSRKESVDLTSAVTASLDDTPNKNTMELHHDPSSPWSNCNSNGNGNGNAATNSPGAPTTDHAVSNDTTVVNSTNHNWIPPHSPQPPIHHPHYPGSHPRHASHPGHPSHPSHPPHPVHPGHPGHPSHHHYHPAHPSHARPIHPAPPGHPGHPGHPHHPPQESRSDVTHHHSYYGMPDHTELRDNFEDPFKYAFGDPHASPSNAQAANYKHPHHGHHPGYGSGGKGRSKSNGSSGRRSSGERGERVGTSGGGESQNRSGRTTSNGGHSSGTRPSNVARSSSANGASSSRRSKKRKHSRERQEPLDGQHSPPPLPTIESAPTATLEMIHPAISRDRSWGNSAGSPDSRRRNNASRNGRSSSHRRSQHHPHLSPSSSHHHPHHHPHHHQRHHRYPIHPDISSSGRSSTWHGAPPPASAHHHAGPGPGPPPYPPHGHPSAYPPHPPPSADPIHSAFLPPIPAPPPAAGQPPPPPSSGAAFHPPNVGSAPPREVYITTSKSSGGSGKAPSTMPTGPPQFVMYPPPPYNYPPAQGPTPRSNGRSTSHSSAAPLPSGPRNHRSPVPPQSSASQPPPPPLQTGIALLTLPTGQTLSRSQAPGIGWPPAEDLRLTEVMSNHKSSQVNWDQLCQEHGMGRTARECHDRWTRYLKPGSRKGQWREEEDAIVLRVIFSSNGSGGGGGMNGNGGDSDQHPPFTQWADLAPQLPGRTGKQIRDRWVNYLNPAINHLPFSREDDLRLWRGHKDLGKRWVEISVKIFHSTRSENHIKNRWYSAAFKKFIAKEFGMDAYVDAKQAQGGVVACVASGMQHSQGIHNHNMAAQQQHPPGARQVHQHHQQVVHSHQGTRNGMLGHQAA